MRTLRADIFRCPTPRAPGAPASTIVLVSFRTSRLVLVLSAVSGLGLGPSVARAQRAEAWQIVQAPQSSQVYARDGSLIGELGRQVRTSVALRAMPRYLPQAFIAVEDQRFYQHDGVDVVGIAGALKDAVRGAPRGASTITQQLVGNMHPDLIDRSDRSPLRKLKEQVAAREMEKHYSKEQILEAYLNFIHLGYGWYGVDAAARHYFGKPAARVTLAEAATLAALPKGPAIYDPIKRADRARERRDLVLSLMAEQGYITRAQASAAEAEPVRTVPDYGYSERPRYYLDVVRTQAERAGVPVAQGGYRVYTALDPTLQRAAERALAEELAAVEARPGYRHPKYATRASRSASAGGTDYLQGAVVAMDAASGDVRALVGGRDYADSPYDRAVNALRQPGSAFKPIVYATAVAESIAANVVIPDTAIAIPLSNRSVYRPDNSDGLFLGPITMREALARSRNVVAVQIAERVGMDSVIAMARRFGIETPIAPYPSSAIGASAVHPIDLVAAYTAFDNRGARVEPRFIYRIEDTHGRAVWSNPQREPRVAVDPQVAFIVRDMMREVVDRGTATAVRRFIPPSVPVAGKTGTTNDNTDVWFVGMTPDIVAGIWLGFDRPKTITPGAAGGTLAAPVFGRMLAQYHAAREPASWTAPEGIVTAELDRETGQPASDVTPPERRFTEYFLAGTEPGATRFDPWSVFRFGPIR
jgi:penicillin-binding protein 1A